MQVQKVNKQSISKAIKFLKAGKAVAYPTDTSYALAVDAVNLKAVRKLYVIKERTSKKPVHIVVSSLAMAGKFAVVDERSKRITKKFLPGPLTLILKLETHSLKYKSWKWLSASTNSIGIRIPKNKVALELVKKLKRPITATSANPSAHISGGYDSYSAEDVYKQFKNKRYQPDLILDGGKLKKVAPSTIIDTTQARPKLIRKGPVKFKDILSTLSSQTPDRSRVHA